LNTLATGFALALPALPDCLHGNDNPVHSVPRDLQRLSIAEGNQHSLALCLDDTVAARGYNNAGQLGDNTTANRLVPVAVNTTPLAASQRLTRVASGSYAYPPWR